MLENENNVQQTTETLNENNTSQEIKKQNQWSRK